MKWGMYGAMGFMVLVCVAIGLGVRLNVSSSVPRGLYWIRSLAMPVQPGDLVAFHVPRRPAWWQGSTLMVKPVAGVAGDVACLYEKIFWVGPRNYGPVVEAPSGPVGAWLHGCQVVPEAAVVVASSSPRSFDSRYFGPLPEHTLVGRAVPLWIW